MANPYTLLHMTAPYMLHMWTNTDKGLIVSLTLRWNMGQVKMLIQRLIRIVLTRFNAYDEMTIALHHSYPQKCPEEITSK